MKRVWLYERRSTDRSGKRFGIVYLNNKFEKPDLYLDGPHQNYKTPAITLLAGKMYRFTLSYDVRQSDKWQIEWLAQELKQSKRGEVKIKNVGCGIGIDSAPEQYRQALLNALKLAQSTGKHPVPHNLGQPTRLVPLELGKPKRGKLKTTSKSRKKRKEPWKINKSGKAAQFGFKLASSS